MLSFLASICTLNVFRPGNSPETSRADTLDEEQQTLLDRQQNTGGSRLRHYVVTDTPEPAPPNTPRTPREASPQSPLLPQPHLSTSTQPRPGEILKPPPPLPEHTPPLEPLAIFPGALNNRRFLPADCLNQIYSFLNPHDLNKLRATFSHPLERSIEQFFVDNPKFRADYQEHFKGFNLLKRSPIELNQVVYQTLKLYFIIINHLQLERICIKVDNTINTILDSSILLYLRVTIIFVYLGLLLILPMLPVSPIAAIVISSIMIQDEAMSFLYIMSFFFVIPSLAHIILSLAVKLSIAIGVPLVNLCRYCSIHWRWRLEDLGVYLKNHLTLRQTNTPPIEEPLRPPRAFQTPHKRANWLLHNLVLHDIQKAAIHMYNDLSAYVEINDLTNFLSQLKVPFTLPQDFNQPNSKTGLDFLKEWRINRFDGIIRRVKAELVFMALLYSESSFNRSDFITQVFDTKEVANDRTYQLTAILTNYLDPQFFAEFGGLTIIHLAIYLGDPELVKTLITLDPQLSHKPAQENSAIGALTPKEYLLWLLTTPERQPSTIEPLAPQWPRKKLKEWQEILEELP